MTLAAKVWLVFAVLVAALLLVGFILMYLDVSSMAHDLRHLQCATGCDGSGD